MMKRLIYIIVAFTMASPVMAQFDGGIESPFSLGAGARDLSMGGANIAYGDAATSLFWNPAGLARAQQISVSGFHANLYDPGVVYQYFGLALPTLDWGSFGVGLFRLGINDIEERDESNIQIGTFADNRIAMLLSYGKHISGYDVGITMTYEQHTMGDYKATSTPGLNFSINRVFGFRSNNFEELSIALNGRNLIRPGMQMDISKINYPYSADFGVSLKMHPVADWNHTVLLAASVTKIDRINPKYSAGLEYSIGEFLSLRGGIRDDKLAAGCGVDFKNFSFDYALIDRDLGSLNLFSFSTSFGTPVDIKRERRAREREEEFYSMMNSQLTQKNEEMIFNIVEQGKTALDAGDIEEAFNNFDRALFLARNTDYDTTAIHTLQRQTKVRLEKLIEQENYNRLVDSARVSLDSNDYLGARYFAGQALVIMPESERASEILKLAEKRISETTSTAKMIESRIRQADSLLSYGMINDAMRIIETVKKMAPDNDQVRMTYMKIKFEYWRQIASDTYASNNYDIAFEALDTALSIFPGHKWCLDLKAKINDERKREREITVIEKKNDQVSPAILGQVETLYKTAQRHFENGELDQAVAYWERVERLAPGYQSVREYLVKAYKFIGIEYYGQNKLREAIDTWSKAATLDPENNEIRDYIKRSEIEIRKLKELSYEH